MFYRFLAIISTIIAVHICSSAQRFAFGCERIERRKVYAPDRCSEECGMTDAGIKCTNIGCYKPQRWLCQWKCHKQPPVEVEVRKCCVGYKTNAKGQCEDIDECAENGAAAGYCYGCVNTIGSYKCVCRRGYRPETNGGDCVDIDECKTGKAGCAGSCTNTPGSYICSCPAGFKLGADNKSCEDVDECQQPGQSVCSDICLNTYGGYVCGCSVGFELAIQNGVRCVDIDECNGSRKCSHDCQNTNGSFYCSCPKGFVMSNDFHNCSLDHDDEHRCAVLLGFALLAVAILTGIIVADKVKQYRRRRSAIIMRRSSSNNNNNAQVALSSLAGQEVINNHVTVFQMKQILCSKTLQPITEIIDTRHQPGTSNSKNSANNENHINATTLASGSHSLLSTSEIVGSSGAKGCLVDEATDV